MADISVLFTGLLFALSLIVAIGAQNAFVLRQGLLGAHVPAVVGICLLSDVALITLGVGGVGVALEKVPSLLVALTLGGAAFLATYGLMAAWRASAPSSLRVEHAPSAPLAATAATCLAITWLNPHVYLDTIVLLGSVANTHGDERWWFGAGAMFGSALWFTALGFGARWLRPLFARQSAWKVLDVVIAVIMLTMAIVLVGELF